MYVVYAGQSILQHGTWEDFDNGWSEHIAVHVMSLRDMTSMIDISRAPASLTDSTNAVYLLPRKRTWK